MWITFLWSSAWNWKAYIAGKGGSGQTFIPVTNEESQWMLHGTLPATGIKLKFQLVKKFCKTSAGRKGYNYSG